MFRSGSIIRAGIYQLAALVVAFQLGHPVPAHAQAASATITGTAADSQGGVLPGVTITVQNAESGTVRTTVSEADGKYRVPGLPPGRYNVTAELPGFQTVSIKDITLVINQEYTRNLQLGLSTLQESVTVTGEAPIIQATKTEVAAVVTQYGQRVGGVVNIVTKSGTNDLHGDTFEYFRNQQMTRNDVFTQEQIDAGRADPRYKRNQYGFSLGGPVIKNKLHYFGTFERTREHSFFTVNVPAQFYPSLAGSYEGGSFTNIEFVRGDYQMNTKQNLFYRYINQHTEYFCSGCGGTNAAFSQLDNLIPRDMHALGHTWVLSNRVLNEFYFMRATASDAVVPGCRPIHRHRPVPVPERDMGQQPVSLAVPHRDDDHVHRGAGDVLDYQRRAQLENRRERAVLPDPRVGGEQPGHVDVRARSVFRPAERELQLRLAERGDAVHRGIPERVPRHHQPYLRRICVG